MYKADHAHGINNLGPTGFVAQEGGYTTLQFVEQGREAALKLLGRIKVKSKYSNKFGFFHTHPKSKNSNVI